MEACSVIQTSVQQAPTCVHLAGASCAFGVFDGVHAGHRYIIGKALADARARNGHAAVITFNVDPTEIFAPGTPDKLMTNEQRLETLAKTGVDQVIAVQFDAELAALSPEQFLNSLFAQGAPASLFVGVDFHFGTHAAGNVETLQKWGAEHGMAVYGVPLFQAQDAPITATRIRGLLAQGRVEDAAALLGQPYALTGIVEQGRKVGRELGVCTANVQPPPHAMLPAGGVYAAYAIVDGTPYKAAVSVGVPATFEDATQATIEAHLLDFEGDLYGQEITLQFVKFLRPMQKFPNVETLLAHITADIEQTRTL